MNVKRAGEFILSFKALRLAACCELHHLPNSPIVRDVLDNGLRLLTESMPHVRSVSIGVWLTRGSRHDRRRERHRALRRAHALQGHDDPVGRGHRAGDRLDRRPARRLHREGIRQLLHQGPRRAPAARDRHPVRHRPEPGLQPDDIEREKKVVLEEIKMVEDTPDDLVHELFTQGSGRVIRSAARFSARARPSSSFADGSAARLLPRRIYGAAT